MISVSQFVPQVFGKTLLLRGFAEFVAWKQIKNSSEDASKCIVQDIVNFIQSLCIETVVWDGDLYKGDSFTHIIFEVMNYLPHITFVAFKPSSSAEKFVSGDSRNCELGWSQLNTPFDRMIFLQPVTLPENLKWYEKNTLLTQIVYSEILKKCSFLHIMYLGGGQVIKSEMENLENYIEPEFRKKVRILFIDIPRSSFGIDKETGLPTASVQFLGNNSISTCPLSFFPNDICESVLHSAIHLKFSAVQYLVEYTWVN